MELKYFPKSISIFNPDFGRNLGNAHVRHQEPTGEQRFDMRDMRHLNPPGIPISPMLPFGPGPPVPPALPGMPGSPLCPAA